MKPTSKLRERGSKCNRAVDLDGNTLDFLRACQALRRSSVERLLCKRLNALHTQTSRVSNVDKNAAYPPAVDAFKADE